MFQEALQKRLAVEMEDTMLTNLKERLEMYLGSGFNM